MAALNNLQETISMFHSCLSAVQLWLNHDASVYITVSEFKITTCIRSTEQLKYYIINIFQEETNNG